MLRHRISTRLQAIMLALLVTFLWSTSWVLIKYSLEEIPPLTFAGLRYTLAFMILLIGGWKSRQDVQVLSKKDWKNLAVLGLVFYTATQGGVFVSLKYLEAVTFSLLLNISPLLVAIFSLLVLRESPSRWQWAGIMLFLVGIGFYFYPLGVHQGGWLGFLLGGLTVCANAAAALIGRLVNRAKTLSPLVVTVVSMGFGGLVLLGLGLAIEGLPAISPLGWGIILWLALVNTAFAFTLWNKTLQTLSAVESSIINNTMLVQIAVLAVIFLGERLTMRDGLGLSLVMAGIMVVQLATPSKQA